MTSKVLSCDIQCECHQHSVLCNLNLNLMINDMLSCMLFSRENDALLYYIYD